jgi:hypothetical protein
LEDVHQEDAWHDMNKFPVLGLNPLPELNTQIKELPAGASSTLIQKSSSQILQQTVVQLRVNR